MIEEINPELTLVPVSTQGYTSSELGGSYYGSTILLIEQEDGYVVDICTGYDSDEGFYFANLPPVKDCSKLFRFIPETGFYKIGDKILKYSYEVSKTYKKGLSTQHMVFTELNGKTFRFNHSMLISMVAQMVKPLTPPSGDTFVISRRLCVNDGKLITAFRNLTVGDYKDGVAVTPIGAISDRIYESTGGRIPCHRP